MAIKDDQMKLFISKYEKHQTTQDDLLNLQMKILDLEEALNNEKEKHLKELDSNENRHNDLLKRNDHLWSQLTNLEQSYNDALQLIQIQTKENEQLLASVQENEKRINELNDEKQSTLMIVEKMREKNDKLETDIVSFNQDLDKLKLDYDSLNDAKTKESEKNKKELNDLEKKLTDSSDENEKLKKANFDLKIEVDGLVKEKSFIINQNDSAQHKVLKDYLSLQEKHASIKMEMNKLNLDYEKLDGLVKEKEQAIKCLEMDKSQLGLSLKLEGNEKTEVLERLKSLELQHSQVRSEKGFA